MSLVFSAIAPHPPLLIPTIGKDNLKEIKKTKQAMEKLAEDIYMTRPDTVIIISPHASCFGDAFTLNLSPIYFSDFREFGDLTTKNKYKGEMDLSSYLREYSKEQEFPTAAISEQNLDHGSAVPLYYLMPHLPNASILPMGFCDLEWKTHVDFGYMLKNAIAESNKRVAVIASGDLSHALISESPAGYHEAGGKFDASLRELLKTGNTVGMLQMKKQFVADSAECGFRSFLILMGLMRDMKHDYKEYSYESPFGVGYLVSNFVI